MDKGQRGLCCLIKAAQHSGCYNPVGIHQNAAYNQKRQVGTSTHWNRSSTKKLSSKTAALTSTVANLTEQLIHPETSEAPFFLKLRPFKSKIAITDASGDFTYEDLFRRSLLVSMQIKKVLRNRENKNQPINLICPNGVSYVIGQWAIWMSGNMVVPLSSHHTPQALEYFIRDSESALVIAAPTTIDKVEEVALKLGKPLVCLSNELVTRSYNYDLDEQGPFPNLIFNEALYPKENPVMMLYMPGMQNSRLYLSHHDINKAAEYIAKTWQLDGATSMLHSLSLYHTFGIVASLVCPLSVGGRVVLMSQFDSLKVWSQMLGITQLNEMSVTRVNSFAGLPSHYETLARRYHELFNAKKIKTYVHEVCPRRMKLMVSGVTPISEELKNEWKQITGVSLQEF